MTDVLNTWLLIFTHNADYIQVLFFVLLQILGFSHHKPGKDIACALVKDPFHQNKRGFIGCEIAFKQTVLGIAISLMDKWGCQHLHQYGFSAAILKRKQCTFSIEIHGFITDAICIVVVIHIDQTYCINLTHPLPPPVL